MKMQLNNINILFKKYKCHVYFNYNEWQNNWSTDFHTKQNISLTEIKLFIRAFSRVICA